MNIIFLDIDGVLNGRHTKERCGGYIGIEAEKVKLLKELCDKTDSKVVISSTWRLHEKDNDIFWRYLKKTFEAGDVKIYDKTPDIACYLRASEILEWLKDKDVDHIVILDDEDFHWGVLDRFWVDTCTADAEGLTEENIKHITDNFDCFRRAT